MGTVPRDEAAVVLWANTRKGPGCWEWDGLRIKGGYGRIGMNKGYVLTHRLSWELAHGPIPVGMLVCHKCDNPPCVNPDHLFLGTYADNNLDREKKGRGPAKLTAGIATVIRRVYSPGHPEFGMTALARYFGVSLGAIQSLLRTNFPQSWKWAAPLLLAALLPSSVLGFSGTGGPARTQTLWLPLTTTPTPGVAAGSAAWTFSRSDAATCASYVNSAGIIAYAPKNEARFDYSPVTLAALGYLSEGQRSNSLLWSCGFTAAAWVGTRLSAADAAGPAILAPDGTSATYYVIQEDSGASTHFLAQDYTSTSAKNQAFSVYAKAGGRTFICLTIYDNGVGFIRRWYNLGTGVLGSAAQGGSASHWWESSSSIAAAGNGWYRCVIVSGTPTGTAKEVEIFLASADATISYTANSSSLFIWGAQVEDNAAFASSFIGPTAGSAMTRAADSGITYAISGNLSTSAGTLLAVADVYAIPAGQYIVGSASGGAFIARFAGAWNGYVGTTNAYTASWTALNTPARVAMTWASSGLFIARNAVMGTGVAFSGNMNFNVLVAGNRTAADGALWGHIRDVRIFNSALTAREVSTMQSALGAP